MPYISAVIAVLLGAHGLIDPPFPAPPSPAAELILPLVAHLKLAPAVRADQARLGALVTDFVEVASEEPFFDGDAAEAASALLALAAAYHESGLDPRVERCQKMPWKHSNDDGVALGLMQAHREWLPKVFPDEPPSRDEVCVDRRLQIRLGVGVLRAAQAQCPGKGPEFWYGAFAAGQCGITGVSAATYGVFRRLTTGAGIIVERAAGRRWRARFLRPVRPVEPTT